MHERVEVPELPSVMLVGESVHARPDEGRIVWLSVTVPVRPCRLVTVIVAVPFAPAATARLVGDAVVVKSWMM